MAKKTVKKPVPKKPSKSTKSTEKASAKSVTKTAKMASGAKLPKTPLKTDKKSARSVELEDKKSKAKPQPVKASSVDSTKTTVVPTAKVKADKKAAKKAKKASKQEEFDLGDDLISDEELGSEEIPDLAEFVEEEEAESEVETDTDSDESEVLVAEAPKSPDDEVVLTDAEGRRYCRVRDCDQISVVEGYCRYHYLLLWKKIQIRRKILTDGKLERYVEELTSRYPDKFLEMIKKDLRTEKDFLAAIAELEIDESAVDNEFEDETQSYVEEIRGMSETSASLSEEEEF
jgi:hypothetical protein